MAHMRRNWIRARTTTAVLHSLIVTAMSLAWSMAATISLRAQDQASSAATPPVIATDRPAFTDSSDVIARGYLLFENGFTETRNQAQNGFDFPETLARFGLTNKTELRFNVPDYFHNSNTGNGLGSGWGDLGIGLKQQLLTKEGGFDASLVVALSCPTGAKIISSHGYDPTLQLPWSRGMSKNWTAAGMFSLDWPTQSPRRNLTGQATALVDRQITTAWDAFLEYGGWFPQRGGPEHILHTGTSYKISPNQQLDFHLGVGLSSAAPDYFVGVGYSFQFRAYRRECC
jgi:hypothetical protein